MLCVAQTKSLSGFTLFLTALGGVTLFVGSIWLLNKLIVAFQPVEPEQPKTVDDKEPFIDTVAVNVSDTVTAPPRQAQTVSTALAVIEAAPLPVVAGPAFDHSPDFRMVKVDGTQHFLTMTESRVMQRLWEAKQSGHPEVHQSVLLEDLGICSKRLRDVFKRDLDIFKVLIGRGKRKGMFFFRAA